MKRVFGRLNWTQALALHLLRYLLPGLTALAATDAAATPSAFESEVKSVLDVAFEKGEYIAYVTQSAGAAGNAPADAGKQSAGAGIKIPYSSFEIVPFSGMEKPPEAPVESWRGVKVTVIFDESVTDKKVETITALLNERFPLNRDGNSLIISKAPLKAAATEVKEGEDFQLQKTSLEKEQAALEVERLKLELVKSQMNAKETEKPAAVPEAPKSDTAPEEAAPKTPEPVAAAPVAREPSAIEKFQPLTVAVILSLALIVAFVIGFGNVKSGLKPIAEAIGSGMESLGSNIGASSAGSAAPAAAAAAGGGSVDAAHSAEARSVHQVNHGGLPVAAVQASEPSSQQDAAEIREFTEKVREKVEILLKNGSFGFYQAFTDMIERQESLPMAAALLLTLDKQTIQSLIRSVSSQHASSIRDFLNEPGNLAVARGLRPKALQEFYGRIVMDEFLDSPILAMGGMSWLARLSNAEMVSLARQFPVSDIAIFLACLAPARVQKIIQAAEDETTREKMLGALAQVATVTQDQVEPFFNRLQGNAPSKDAAGKDSMHLVNGEKYLRLVVESMEVADQEKVLGLLDSSSAIYRQLRQQFLPFDTVKTLPTAIMREIFGDRQNDQIAQILFACAADLRDVVLGCLPDVKAQTVRDKIKQLDGDEVYRKRNEQKSLQAQKAISSYIAQLAREGIISLDAQAKEEGGNAA